jgi:hypothetical protein
MEFDASDSTDTENQALTYEWDFNSDGTVDETTEGPEGATNDWTFAIRKKYDVSVTVKDATTGVSDPPGRMTVYPGDTPPNTPSITSPADESTFTVPRRTARQLRRTSRPPVRPRTRTMTGHPEVAGRQHHDGNHDHPYANGPASRSCSREAEPEGCTPPTRRRTTGAAPNREDDLGLTSETARYSCAETVDLRSFRARMSSRSGVNGKTFDQNRSPLGSATIDVAAPRQRTVWSRWAFKSWSDRRTCHAHDIGARGPEDLHAASRGAQPLALGDGTATTVRKLRRGGPGRRTGWLRSGLRCSPPGEVWLLGDTHEDAAR